ncbi:DUF6262 family protein [Arthrobacter sp. ok362]|uniref:DUF6262 family protein n=1 Tax=Arthrobacter sp. ok362 TaxID=1761745 RepID=UPI000880AA74|nr:DUF6262 family protein [Arthrobacter sp. ok362]SDL96688.1 hypothetical protein SAMN04487913_1198 [Arthrobacter sp. ok362]
MTNTSTPNRVERACTELLRKGQAVTFAAVAAHTGLGRTTLYRDPMIRATIEENRHRAAASGTLNGLTEEIATLPTALDILATSVRRHEEQLQKLTSRSS